MSLTVLHPAPEPGRYRLNRAGLIGLYEYEDETFEFERGRLLLRGPNGAGKSKALELMLPLLLDGELRAERLDPFGGSGRSMRWNLLGDEESGRATGAGYSWLELERVEDDGRRRWVTLALGVAANRSERDVRSWFALIEADQAPGEALRGSRVGINASLSREHAPISRTALAELAGEVIDSASAYRAEVNRVLFGLPEERYAAIVRLLLSLRKPQLSKALDPSELSVRLTEALPELERDSVLRVSARLDQLDRIRREAGELREVRDAVAGFAGTYRDWARAALRERGAALEESAEHHGSSETELRAARSTAEAALARRSELADQEQRLDADLATARGAQEELRSSEGWREAERLDELRRRADGAEAERRDREQALERARQDLERAEAALAEASAAVAEQQEALSLQLAAAEQAAAVAGIAEHAAIIDGLEDDDRDLGAIGALLTDRSDARRRDVDRLRELSRELERAEADLARARERFEAAEAVQRERQAERAAAGELLEDARAELVDGFHDWLSSLASLSLDDELIERISGALAKAGEHDGPSGRELLTARASAVEQELRDERAQLGSERIGIAAEREPPAAEHDRLEAGGDPTPEPLPYRTAERAGREGAPLWALVEFSSGLEAGERAGIEGALEGAGLLDAWVTPRGEALGIDDAELVRAGTPTAGGRTLAEALEPISGGPVVEPVVGEILEAIAWPSTGEVAAGRPGADLEAAGGQVGAGPVAFVCSDGRFGLGPLRGSHRPDRARFIGAQARAANRARRLAELVEAVERLDRRRERVDLAIGELEGRLELLGGELEAFPDTSAAVRVHASLGYAQREERAAAVRTASEQQAMEGQAARREQAFSEAQAHARERRLPSPKDMRAIDALGEAISRYRESGSELLHAATLLRERGRRRDGERARRQRAGEDAGAEGRRQADALREASERRGAHEQALASVGASVEQLRARLAEQTTAVAAAEAEQRRLRDEREEAAERSARAGAEVERCARDLEDSSEALAGSRTRLSRLTELGAWELALGDAAPADLDQATAWSVERVLQVLGSISRAQLATRRALETLIEDVDKGADELRHRLASSAEFEVTRRRLADDPALTVVEIRHGGRSRPVAALESWLEGELAAREQTIADGDRKLFETFLVGGLADELRERITDASRLVASMNQTLAGCETSSGMSIELEWRPLELEDAALREVTKLLRRDVALLPDEARGRLVEFLRRRIGEARDSLEHGSTAEHVMAALDYRAWHEFRVIQVKDGRRERLTRRRHQKGSGGEKAVALHLPLFAAAAAQFSAAAAHAPRLILLDEALAGIDEKMRAQLLGLLERFDLDFVLTSHELWGCYPEVSALGIYHLQREPGLPGVASAHFRWDGERRVEVEPAA